MNGWVTIIVALIAGGGPLIAQLIGGRRQAMTEFNNLALQLDLDRAKDERAIRDRQLQQLREVIVPIYRAVISLQDIALWYLSDPEHFRVREPLYDEALGAKGEYRVSLVLAHSHFDFASAYERICDAASEMHIYVVSRTVYDDETLQRLYQKVAAAVKDFEMGIQMETARLELPIAAGSVAEARPSAFARAWNSLTRRT